MIAVTDTVPRTFTLDDNDTLKRRKMAGFSVTCHMEIAQQTRKLWFKYACNCWRRRLNMDIERWNNSVGSLPPRESGNLRLSPSSLLPGGSKLCLSPSKRKEKLDCNS